LLVDAQPWHYRYAGLYAILGMSALRSIISGEAMKVCGIDIRGRDIILVIVNSNGEKIDMTPLPRSKLPIENEDDADQLRSLKTTLEGIFKEHGVEAVGIKARQQKGQYAAGAASFKLETIVQLNNFCNVVILHPNTIAKILKGIDVNPPAGMKKYCEDAFLVAIALARQEAGK
jgi:hypothetical protein